MAGSSKSNVKDFIQWALFGFLIALIVTFLLGRRDRTDRIPTQQPIIKQGNTNSISTLPIISRVQPFALTNQFGNRITDKDLNGTPWLANIILPGALQSAPGSPNPFPTCSRSSPSH